MRFHSTAPVAAALILAGLTAPGYGEKSATSGRPLSGRPSPASRTTLPPCTTGLGAYFEANRGQVHPSVSLLARARGYRLFLAGTEAVFSFPDGPATTGREVLRMRFVGARTDAATEGSGPLPGRSHYLVGNVPSKWVRHVPHFREAVTRGLYPGIDLRWRALPDGLLEYDFVVSPGADTSAILLKFEGADSVKVESSGDLLVESGSGTLRNRRPVLYQEKNGRRRIVEGVFADRVDGTVGFEIGAYDARLPLVLDPVVSYSTHLGGGGTGSNGEYAADVDCGYDGSAYLTGRTNALDFPVVDGSYMTTPPGGSSDGFVTKLNPTGSALVYSTYFGGTNHDRGDGLAVDSDGHAYVSGTTYSDDFPVVSAFQSTKTGSFADALVLKLTPDGSSLVFSTYLGGSTEDRSYGMALRSGEVTITGRTEGDFPLKTPFRSMGSSTEGFVARLSADGSSLKWSSLLGGSSQDEAYGLTVDDQGRTYVVGYTFSTDFPTHEAVQNTLAGLSDAFLTRIAADGTSIEQSTYFGGTKSDVASRVALDGDGVAWVVGNTASSDFPLVEAIQADYAGGTDGFVAGFASEEATIVASSFLGGSLTDQLVDVRAGPTGSIFLLGTTISSDLPVVGALQDTYKGGNGDAMIGALEPGGTAIRYLSYYGGSGRENGIALALDRFGRVHFAGRTQSADFPTVAPFQGTLAPTENAFIVVLRDRPFPPSGVMAELQGLTKIHVSWTDNSGSEEGFRLERKVGEGAFQILANLAPDTTTYLDSGLAPEETYTYRLLCFNDLGDSDYSEETSRTTPPEPVFPPASPGGVVAVADGPRRIVVTWTDNSDNEDFFVLARSVDGVLFDTLATPFINATSYTDTTVLPDRTYWYKVRAANPIGFSLSSTADDARTDATLSVLLTKGKIKDSVKFGKDSISLQGTLSLEAGAVLEEVDPLAAGMRLRMGGWSGQQLVLVGGADAGWKVKKGRYQWKAPKGSSTKAKLKYDSATGIFSIVLARIDLLAAPESPVGFAVELGTEGVTIEDPWTLKKPGLLKFP